MPGQRKRQYLAGLRAGIPIILGYIPVGIAYAILARQAGLSSLETCLMSLTVLAGAGEMVAAGMYGEGAAIFTIILATFIINLRHLIMSTCVMTRIRDERPWVRWLSCAFITDESFAMFTTGPRASDSGYYFFGLVTAAYTSWNLGSFVGAVCSDLLPPLLTASLGIALYAMFIGILVPNLPGNFRLIILVIFTGALNTLLCRLIDNNWAMITSTLIGAAVGTFFVAPEKKETASDTQKEGDAT